MVNLKFRYLIAALLLSITAIIINGLQYDSLPEDETGISILNRIPIQFGKWKGQDVSLDETVYDILETRTIIHRSFTGDNGENVFLSVVHYQDTKVGFHSPEACLGGIGEKVDKTNKKIVLYSGNQQIKIHVAQIISKRSTGQTLTYYFYKSGQFIGSNYIKMRLNIAANKITMNDTRGSLIRISTTLIPGNETAAKLMLIDFTEALLPYIKKVL